MLIPSVSHAFGLVFFCRDAVKLFAKNVNMHRTAVYQNHCTFPSTVAGLKTVGMHLIMQLIYISTTFEAGMQ